MLLGGLQKCPQFHFCITLLLCPSFFTSGAGLNKAYLHPAPNIFSIQPLPWKIFIKSWGYGGGHDLRGGECRFGAILWNLILSNVHRRRGKKFHSNEWMNGYIGRKSNFVELQFEVLSGFIWSQMVSHLYGGLDPKICVCTLCWDCRVANQSHLFQKSPFPAKYCFLG